MKHVSIVIPQGQPSLVNIMGTHQILHQVNEILSGMGKPAIFEIELVGIKNEVRQSEGLFKVLPQKLLQEVTETDLIIIPAIHGDQELAAEQNKEFVPWIIRQYRQGAEIASFCIAAFFLASTGLLNGKQCATHWIHANEFRMAYPEVQLVDDKIMTEDQGIYTSGGAYSYLNLLLYLIEKQAGREIAILIAKTFMIDIERKSQSPFIIFQGQKEHEDFTIIKAQNFIEEHFQEKIDINHLAEMAALSRRSLERRFKKATANTLTEYIQRVKIEAAKKALETGRKNVTEVMYDIGYSDVKSFRGTFKKFTGISPIQYKTKYSREVLWA